MTDHPRHAPAPAPDHLGPWPDATVAMFADLGLAEDEIARHLQIDRKMVRLLRQCAGKRDSLARVQNPAQAHRMWCPCRWPGLLRARFWGR